MQLIILLYNQDCFVQKNMIMERIQMKHYFNNLLRLELDERRNSYRSVRTARWESEISKRTEEYFENIYIENIDEQRLYRFFSFLRIKDNGELYSDKYIKAVFSLVKAVFQKAVIKQYIRYNPLDYGFKRPKGNIPHPTERLLSDETIRKLLIATENNMLYGTVVRVLLMTGMRIGELLGLYWSDIDFDQAVIHIRRSAAINYKEGLNGDIIREGMGLYDTKTASSNRDLPVMEQCLEIFRNWLKYRDAPINVHWRNMIEEKHNLMLVFPNRNGNIMDYSILRQGLVDICRKNGITETVSFHKLRHNYASDLLSAGVDLAVVSRMLGHNNIETTANTYVKVRMEPMKNAIKMQSRYFKRNNII